MPLVAPPDHSKTLSYLAIGLSICLGIWALTRHTIPIAGDNIHRLPFGGCYRDGTKAILYNRPGRVPTPTFSFGKLEAFFGVIILIGLLVVCSSRKSSVCHVCGRVH
nr:triple gene block protein 2 [Cowpea mild mottle virus]